MIRKILNIAIWCILIAGVVIALAFLSRQHQSIVCDDFSLVVLNPGPDALTDAATLRSSIIAATDTLEGKRLSEIDPYIIHQILEANPYVKQVDVQTSISGNMTADVELRKAIARIFDRDGQSYYMDEEGWMMPVNPGFSARVLVVNGSIPGRTSNNKNKHIASLPEKSLIRELYSMAQYLHKDEFLGRLVSQVWRNPHGEMEMIPLIGEYTIKFGGFDHMEKKFENLSVYYQEGAGKAGWIDYSSIDLRYENQVICSK